MRGSSVALFPTDHPAAAGAGGGEAATARGKRCCCGEGASWGSRYCLGCPVRRLFLREAPTPIPIVGLVFFLITSASIPVSFFGSLHHRFGLLIKQRKEKHLCL